MQKELFINNLPVLAPVTIVVFPTKHVGLLSHPILSFEYNINSTNNNTITPITINVVHAAFILIFFSVLVFNI